MVAEVQLSDSWVNFFWPVAPNGDESGGDGGRYGDHWADHELMSGNELH